MLNQELQELGLNPTEAAVYLAAVAHGRISHTELGHTTGINRTTVYSTVNQLALKGLVAEDLGTRPTQVVALPLQSLLDTQQRELERTQARVAALAQPLARLAKQAEYSVPAITFVDHERVESHLYARLPDWVGSVMADDLTHTWWGFQDPSFVEGYEPWIDHQWAKYAPEGMSLKLLTNQSQSERRMGAKGYERRQIAFWDKATGFTASTWVCGNYLILVDTRNVPHNLVEIHDRVLAENFRALFRGIWQTLPGPASKGT